MGKMLDFLASEGIDVKFDSSSHYFTITRNDWQSPKLHPISVFRLLIEYMPDWETFIREIPEARLKFPELRVSGDDLTDAFFILFGGRKGLDEVKKYILSIIRKKYGKKIIIDGDTEDNMIESCWVSLNLGSDTRRIIKFLSRENYYNAVIRNCLSYITTMV